METRTHRRLKQLAVAFLREHGCAAVATEVRCPIARYRLDVAGYFHRPALEPGRVLREPADAVRGRPFGRVPPRTVLIECKQSRADFLRDRRDRDELLTQRSRLDRYRRGLEERRIRREEPELRRRGSSLFPELEEWDYASSRIPEYRRVLRRLRRIDLMLHGETKFCMIARYALADRLYLAAPSGMILPNEVPPGWGLLECSQRSIGEDDPNANLFGDSVLKISVRSHDHLPRHELRERLLRNIAVAASTAWSNSIGVLA